MGSKRLTSISALGQNQYVGLGGGQNIEAENSVTRRGHFCINLGLSVEVKILASARLRCQSFDLGLSLVVVEANIFGPG